MNEAVAASYFCTYFDINYLPRALALHRSLQQHRPAFRLFALCMDDETFQQLSRLALPEITPIALSELERANVALARSKEGRSRVEYYYTCGPAYILHVLEKFPEVDLLTYLDADLFFFSDLQPIYDEFGDSSVGLVEHRFSPRHEARNRFGVFNVGVLMFRRDEYGFACLRWWSQKCIEWCFDRLEGDRYADQKYLDQWPKLFQGVKVIRHKGVNVAPWNVDNYHFSESAGRLYVDEAPLIVFHFHGFKELKSWLFDTNLGRSGVIPSPVLRKRIFGAYIEALRRFAAFGPMTRSIRNAEAKLLWPVRGLKTFWRISVGVITRSYLIEYEGRFL